MKKFKIKNYIVIPLLFGVLYAVIGFFASSKALEASYTNKEHNSSQEMKLSIK